MKNKYSPQKILRTMDFVYLLRIDLRLNPCPDRVCKLVFFIYLNVELLTQFPSKNIRSMPITASFV